MSGMKVALYTVFCVLAGLLIGLAVFTACTAALFDVTPADPATPAPSNSR